MITNYTYYTYETILNRRFPINHKMKKNYKIKIKNCTIIFNMKICAQIVKIYAQPFKSYIPYFYPPPTI